jgi:hypothetical protein
VEDKKAKNGLNILHAAQPQQGVKIKVKELNGVKQNDQTTQSTDRS